jgi:hypothetical protein
LIDLTKPFSLDDPRTWRFKPQILVHDVGTTQDRSTAVVGGVGAFEPNPSIGVVHLEELPIGLRGTARATALAEVDRKYLSNNLIVTDFSNDQSYSEQMSEVFGARVIGVSIGPAGDGNGFTRIPGAARSNAQVLDRTDAAFRQIAQRDGSRQFEAALG